MATEVSSVRPYCGVGCGMNLHVDQGKVIKVIGVKSHPTNFGRLCTKDSSSSQALREVEAERHFVEDVWDVPRHRFGFQRACDGKCWMTSSERRSLSPQPILAPCRCAHHFFIKASFVQHGLGQQPLDTGVFKL